MYRRAANENKRPVAVLSAGAPKGRELHVITTKALLQAMPVIQTDRERFLSLLQPRRFVTHADAIEALCGRNKNEWWSA